jgi:hypothetical protein
MAARSTCVEWSETARMRPEHLQFVTKWSPTWIAGGAHEAIT